MPEFQLWFQWRFRIAKITDIASRIVNDKSRGKKRCDGFIFVTSFTAH
jgi:hypothetical protein